VLCYLDGKTQDEAARELGWTLGALRGRLERGRDRLRARLVRRGLTLSAAVLVAALAPAAPCGGATAALEGCPAEPPLLSLSEAPGVSVQAAALAKGVLHTMFASKLRAATLVFLGIGVLGGGGAATIFGGLPADQASAAAEAPEPKPPDEKAIRQLIK